MATKIINITPHDDDYVLIPTCTYNVNRFNALNKRCPPMFVLSEARKDMTITMTDVPRLEKMEVDASR